MCGIGGIFSHDSNFQVDPNLLERICDNLKHRGPDGKGIHTEGGLGLAHTRLAVIDVDGGAQPMWNNDKSVVVVYNGEIYNFREVRKELEAKGSTFRTSSDTEVLLAAWEQWREQCLEHFNGMFAFALWDRNQQTFFIARDRLGIKPLYYSLSSDGTISFGSEIKAVLPTLKDSPELDPLAIEEYFAYGYIPAPRTIYRQISKLEPGHYFLARRGHNTNGPTKYWDLSFEAEFPGSFEEAALAFDDQLSQAVQRRLISDVPLGAFLSGGLDSSAIVESMSRSAPSSFSALTVSFDEASFDESPLATQLAVQFGIDHHIHRVQAQDISLIDKLAGYFDEPFADSSALPTYALCRETRKLMTVALSGDGGDENFAGYRTNRVHELKSRLRAALPSWLRQGFLGPLGTVYPKLDWAPRFFRAKRTLQTLAMDNLGSFASDRTITTYDQRMNLFSGSLRERLGGYNARTVLERHAQNAPSDPISFSQYMDFKTYLPDDVLTKVDRMSMANSLEVRVPMLDHELVQNLAILPTEYKFKDGKGKRLLRTHLIGRVPDSILSKPKSGFSIPQRKWLQVQFKDEVHKRLLSPTLIETGLFEPLFLRQVVQNHTSGRRDYGDLIWALLAFQGFLRE